MSGIKRSMIYQEDDESDEECDQFMTVVIGEYWKMKHEQCKRHRGSVFGHKVYDRSREHDKKIYHDYFAENPIYLSACRPSIPNGGRGDWIDQN
jgi:hypothetical protein